MPIKDLQKAREYKRLWAAKKRKQNVESSLFVEPAKSVEPNHVEPILKVEPRNSFVEPVELNVEPRNVEPVEPKPNNVKPVPIVEPCQLNHLTLTELFQQATIKIRQDYKLIYQDSETARKCFNCHNLQRNYQIMLNLLEKYWAKSKKLERK